MKGGGIIKKRTMHFVNVNIAIGLTDQDVEDLIVTAIEGGIGYWACLDNTTDSFLNAPDEEPVSITAARIMLTGGGITFIDEENDKQSWVLTLEKLKEGVRLFLEGEDNGADYIEDGCLDMSYIDADGADQIVQYALFGEIVYG